MAVDNIYLNDTHIDRGYEVYSYQPFTQQQASHHNKQNNRYSEYSYHHHGGLVPKLRLSCINDRYTDLYQLK